MTSRVRKVKAKTAPVVADDEPAPTPRKARADVEVTDEQLRERVLAAWRPDFLAADFVTLAKSFSFVAPVAMADLAEMHSDIKARIPAGYALDIVLRGERVEVTLHSDVLLATVWIDVQPATA